MDEATFGQYRGLWLFLCCVGRNQLDRITDWIERSIRHAINDPVLLPVHLSADTADPNLYNDRCDVPSW